MYQNIRQLATYYGVSRKTISRRVREMEELTRYPERAVLRSETLVLIDTEIFEDYMINRKEIKRERNEGITGVSVLRSNGRKS